MADYRVSFRGHLRPDCTPEGWPNPVLHDLYIRANSFEALRSRIDLEALTLIKQNGMIILKNSKKPHANDTATIDLRAFVPMSSLMFIDQETQLIAGDISDEVGLAEGEKAS